jgi:hypothetical protein
LHHPAPTPIGCSIVKELWLRGWDIPSPPDFQSDALPNCSASLPISHCAVLQGANYHTDIAGINTLFKKIFMPPGIRLRVNIFLLKYFCVDVASYAHKGTDRRARITD